MNKKHVSPDELRLMSVQLAMQAVKAGNIPTHMVALWRGGAPIGCIVHEVFKYLGYEVDHIAIRTSRYTAIGEASERIAVHNLGYLVQRLQATSKLMIVDDVWESGGSVVAVLDELKAQLGDCMPEHVVVAVPFYKPDKNKAGRVPDHYVETTNAWLVFPHELEGLSPEEIATRWGEQVAKAMFG